MATLSDIYPGISNISSIPDEQRLYDRDKNLIKIATGSLALSRIMMDRFKSRNVIAGDPETKYKSDVDRPILLAITVDSTVVDAGNRIHKIWLAKKDAIYVDVDTTLLVQKLFYNGTTYVRTAVATNSQQEMLRVIERGTESGGNVWFNVIRGWKAASGGVAGTPTQLTTTAGDNVVYIPRAVAEGNNEGRVYGDTPHEEYNYCEINLEKWGVNMTTANTTILQDQSIIERNGQRQLDQFFKGYEMKCIYGRRHTELDDNNDRIWWTGGLDEYIRQAHTGMGYAGDNIVDFKTKYGAVSYQTINQLLADKFFRGNRKEKFWVMDVDAYVRICNAFDNKVRIYNQDLSLRYGIQVETIRGSGGGAAHLIVHDQLSLNGLKNISYLVDFDYFKYMHLQNMDVQILENVEKGNNIFKHINYMFMQAGIKRFNPFAHWYIFNLI